MNDNAFLIFIKYPEAGKVKTRLANAIGFESAALVYRDLAEVCVARYGAIPHVTPYIYYDPPDRLEAFQNWLGKSVCYWAQPEGQLGQRLAYGMQNLLQRHKTVIALGTDSPNLPLAYLTQAVEELNHHDVVVGPTEDGGYYLIGLSRYHPELFEGIPWSTGEVFSRTMHKAQGHGLQTHQLPRWYDIDTIADLERLMTEDNSDAWQRLRALME